MEFILLAVISILAAMSASKPILRLLVILVSIGSAAFLWHYRHPSSTTELSRFRPADSTAKPKASYAGSQACKSCHPGAYASWYRTYHRTMTQTASETSILAPFDGRVLTAAGRTYQVIKKGDTYFINMPAIGTEGKTKADRLVRPVVMTTGSHNMQAYWAPVHDFEGKIPSRDRNAFNQRCGHCHGMDAQGGKVPGLIDTRMTAVEIEDAMDLARHVDLDRKAPDYKRALRYALTVQYTGRLLQFPFVYLIKAKRWAHEDHTFLQPPTLEHTPEPYGDNWSDGCDQCHSVRPHFSPRKDHRVGDAEVVELGIACESCHGPGGGHIQRHQNPVNRYFDTGKTESDKIINPTKIGHRESSYICAQCHAELVVKENAGPFNPGQQLDEFAHVVQYLPDGPPTWLAEELDGNPTMLRDLFWRDGTIRVAGRKYNGMALTGCYTKGEMSCITCHSMHGSDPEDQLKEIAKGDQVCVDCHPTQGANIAAHTHHKPGSGGSRCYNCHMPHTTVGLLGLIRSHRVDSPSAENSARTGRPNACNLCHLDKTLAEVAEHLNKWYEQPLPQESNLNDRYAASIQWLLRGNAVQRATIAWHMGWGPARTASGSSWAAPFLAELLDDPYSAIRFIAGKALESLPEMEGLGYDYIGSKSQFLEVANDARKRWLKTKAKTQKPTVMMVDGILDRKAVLKLKKQRDDTRVRINE